MAEKATRFKLPSKLPSRKTSAGGGGGAALPAPAPRREPSSSPPRSPSPPEPFTYDPGAGISGDGGGGAAAAAPAPAPRRKPSSSPPRSPSPPEPFTYVPVAGITGYGGGGDGAAAAAPVPAPRRGPYSSPPRSPSPPRPLTYSPSAGSKPSSSLPRSPLPPKPFTYNPSPGSSAGAGGGSAAGPTDTKDSSDEKPDEFKTENGWSSLFMSDPEVLSNDPQNLPQYIGRQDCEPLSTQEFLSLRLKWQQLLDGKKTYLRRAAKSNYADRVFVTPEPLEKALRCQEPLSHLVRGAAGKPITQQRFKILSEHYVCFRPFRSDGSQFYRAFLFSYLENLGKMQGSQAEVTRLMGCVERSMEFEHLVNSVANGLNAAELYKISLHEISSSRILSLLRLLTEVHIRTYEADYNRALASPNQNEKINALLFCKESVRPFGIDAALLQMKALSQALGIPLHLAAVDGVKSGETVQVKCIDIIPRSGPLSSTRRYYLSSATDKPSFMPPGNLFLSDRMPLVTILITPNATAILYRK